MIVIVSFCIAHFVVVTWPSLSLLTNLGLKSAFSDINIVSPVFSGH
jgi:hypothetical protein